MEKLRRAWGTSVQTVGRLRKFLGRHGEGVQKRVDARQDRQQQRVQQKELPVGFAPCTSQQHSPYAQASYAMGFDFSSRSRTPFKDKRDDHPVSPRQRVGLYICSDETSEFHQPVYDLINCGPRNRFVVRGVDGPLIVHNCTQAICADILREKTVVLHEDDLYNLALHTHDELCLEVPDKDVGRATKYLEKTMITVPAWAQGLPLDVSLWSGKRYRK